MTRTAQQRIDDARIAFNRAFYGNGSPAERCAAAYECSIIYEMANNSAFGRIFEQIGNYYYMQQDKFRTIVHED